MSKRHAFFGTFWRGGLGAIGRCISIANDLKKVGFSCYFFAEDVAAKYVREAGFISVRPPYVDPPKEYNHPPGVSRQRVVGAGAIFGDLGEFYSLRGYDDSEYVERAFQRRFEVIEDLEPDILFGYWSWETTIAARLAGKPLTTIIQQSLHPSGGGFIDNSGPSRGNETLHSFNNLLAKLNLPSIRRVEDLMVGDLTLISGVPSSDPLPLDATIRYCGPLLWFESDGKETIKSVPSNRRIAWVYASDCESWVGGRFLIRRVVPILIEMGFFVLISSGGHPTPDVNHPQVLCVESIPGSAAAKMAEIVIGRGGHDLFWTSIMARKPFFGAPPNSEWLNYCQRARSLGVGDYTEVESLHEQELVARIERLVSSSEVAANIEKLCSEAQGYISRRHHLTALNEFWPALFPGEGLV